jgi:chromosome segregation ATPase
MTLIEQLENAKKESADAIAKQGELTAKISELEAKISEHNATAEKIAALQADLVSAKESFDAAVKARDEAQSESAKLRDAMALKPSAFEHITDGAKPAAESAPASEEPLAQKLSRLTAEGKHAEARDLYKQHKATFKRLGISRS